MPRSEGFENPLPSEITSAQAINQIPEAIRRNLSGASLALKDKRAPYELALIADRLAENGVISKSDYDEGNGRDANYYIENPNKREPRYRVLALHYAPDFHRGRGENFISYDQTLYNERGLATEAFTKAAEGDVTERAVFQYHSNDQLRRREHKENRFGKFILTVEEFDELGRPLNSTRTDSNNHWLLHSESYEYPSGSNTRFPHAKHWESYSDQNGKLVRKGNNQYQDNRTHTDVTQFFREDGSPEKVVTWTYEQDKLVEEAAQNFNQE